ncbi:MAG: hypothetical protein ABI948_00030 [Thermoleophilia bacterium]
MLPADVVALYRDLQANGVRVWLMGGWGVDALLGRQTRPHHDVDLLVEVASLERLRARLDELGFDFKYLWDDECRWVHDDAWTKHDEQPTAFVCGDPAGREFDVHVVRQAETGEVEMLWNSPYEFTADGLRGEGLVGGQRVRCLSREEQRRAHTGYDLPPQHVRDLRLLAAEG